MDSKINFKEEVILNVANEEMDRYCMIMALMQLSHYKRTPDFDEQEALRELLHKLKRFNKEVSALAAAKPANHTLQQLNHFLSDHCGYAKLSYRRLMKDAKAASLSSSETNEELLSDE